MSEALGSAVRSGESPRWRQEAELAPAVENGDGAFGSRMAEYLAGGSDGVVVAQTRRHSTLVVTRLRCDTGLSTLSAPIPAEEAFVVCSQLTDLSFHQLWIGGVLAQASRQPKGGVGILDLERAPRLFLPTPFDCLHFYVTRETLKKVAEECGAAKIDKLSWPYGEVDETLSHLAWAMLLALDRPENSNRFFIDHIVLALNTHFATAYGGMQPSPRNRCGGLASWQERRSKELMTSRIANPISLEELANECRLSTSHFARAFKKTTGHSPHRWLIKRRIETAKGMLVSTKVSLCEVAIACGFADQSHLSRVFANMVGATPGSWRRERTA